MEWRGELGLEKALGSSISSLRLNYVANAEREKNQDYRRSELPPVIVTGWEANGERGGELGLYEELTSSSSS